MSKALYKSNKGAYKNLKIMTARPPAKLNERQKSEVKRIIKRRSELKYHSKEMNGQTFGIAGGLYLTDITAIAQGVTDTTRVGDKAELSRIEYTFTLTPTDKTISHTVRVLFFQYKPNDAAALTNIDGIVDNGPGGSVDPWSPYDHDFKSDYTILSDRLYQLNPNQSIVVTKGITSLPTKRAKKELTFTAGATFGANHVYVAFIGSQLLGVYPVSISGRTRCFFRDS